MTIWNQDDDVLISRKKAAEFLETTTGALAVDDCLNRHNLKPEKKDGRVYYRMSALKKEKQRRVAKRQTKTRFPL